MFINFEYTFLYEETLKVSLLYGKVPYNIRNFSVQQGKENLSVLNMHNVETGGGRIYFWTVVLSPSASARQTQLHG